MSELRAAQACSGQVKAEAESAENIMKFGFLNSLVKFLYFCPYFFSLHVFQKYNWSTQTLEKFQAERTENYYITKKKHRFGQSPG